VDRQAVELFLKNASGLIWGWPLILSLMALGAYFSWKLKLLNPKALGLSFKYAMGNGTGTGDVSIFGSLCTALSATLGTGNIVGMALAVTMGGPGALFWLWISSILCLALKYAESLLAVKYRKIENDGTVSGGPMHYMSRGLGCPMLAKIFALSGMAVALVGIGTLVQSNSIAATCDSFNIPRVPATAALTIIVAAITMGGLRKIAAVAEKIVPLMTIFYVGSAAIALIANIGRLPKILCSIFHCAFAPRPVLFGGVSAAIAASIGVRRGIFSHESGLGSSAIAAAAARVDSPAKQGFASMAGAIFSVIVCTMTGLVVLMACDDAPLVNSQPMDGALLTSYAFGRGLGNAAIGKYVIGISIVLFAFTTIIGWNYYGEKCTQYVFGKRAVFTYKLAFLCFVAIGPFFDMTSIFSVADTVTGIMAAVNLLGLAGLRKVVAEETDAFFATLRRTN
jgi:AGCS family alanine or glycine:cation symporter